MKLKLKIKKKKETTLAELDKGSLFLHGKTIGFKSEYGNNEGRIDAYIVGSGEFFWGYSQTIEQQRNLKVIPIEIQQP